MPGYRINYWISGKFCWVKWDRSQTRVWLVFWTVIDSVCIFVLRTLCFWMDSHSLIPIVPSGPIYSVTLCWMLTLSRLWSSIKPWEGWWIMLHEKRGGTVWTSGAWSGVAFVPWRVLSKFALPPPSSYWTRTGGRVSCRPHAWINSTISNFQKMFPR